ncbi:hypothetical protein FC99_GL001803 [Levilactobacillus koreensis JCM 16448]|uniref:hypothetical protein n=1 Tax=Levilactobacillus koreensis TaxID=637971 RepID=UPI0006F14C21|nr:hypothetical protein [Levilactobacillus koreensis]KRK86056.1 hypothetical protein FC99_GL001803 [Levilactobacillus koreensis JCM 16448]
MNYHFKRDILRYINMDGGDEEIKQLLMKYSPDQINEDSIQGIIYQMNHGETHI